MNLGKQKQLAARALGVSPKRVKFSEDHKKDLSELISRESVKDMVSDGAIKKIPKKGNSRTRANHIAEQKKKGRQKGHGSRKGTQNARFNGKEKWMIKIRALRKYLKSLKDEEKLDNKTYRDLYRKAKGNFFRNKRHLMLYIQQHHLSSENKESGSTGDKKESGSTGDKESKSSKSKKSETQSKKSQEGGGEK